MSDDELDRALRREITERVRGQMPPTPDDLARTAAEERDPERRAQAVVVLAERLRAHGHDELALRCARIAVESGCGTAAGRAADVLIVGILAAGEHTQEAVDAGETLLAHGREQALLRALAHAYGSLYVETGTEMFRQRWKELSVEIAPARAA